MFKQFLVVCTLALGLASLVEATSVRQLLLDEIIDTSAVSFHGTCTANLTERDAQTNLVVTYTTFEVKDVLKGNVKATHVIKQIGGKMPGGEMSFRVDGVPAFAVGEEYVVFLAGVSAAGFSSPIGLAQGKFTVKQNSLGQRVANGRDFRDMAPTAGRFVLLPQATPPIHDLDLNEFKQLTRVRVANTQ